MNREEAMVWLSTVENMWSKKIMMLLEYFGTPQEVFAAGYEELLKSGCLKEPDIEAVLRHKEDWNWVKIQESLKQKEIWVLTEDSEDYPERLKCLPERPRILYGKGQRERLKELSKPTVAVIGARVCSSYGKYVAEKFARDFAMQGVTVVSGMARGVDSAAHRGAMEGNGLTVAVLGCGVDVCYPNENQLLYEEIRKKGILLSEYPPGTKPLAWQFPQRNRIISGLSGGVMIVEAKEASGSLITARWALEQGLDVYAVPGRINDPLSVGCNRLIREGAMPVLEVADVLSALGLNKKNLEKEKIFLEKENEVVYSVLGLYPQSMDEILQKTHIESGELHNILLKLQLAGLVEEPAKNYYVRMNF